MKLSICMMVKDEEKNLERCLKSLQPVMNAVSSELIIVDTGSKDKTVDIARKYTEKVYFHAWANNFSEIRNISISYASGDWIYTIDADEEIVDSKNFIKFLCQDDMYSEINAGFMTYKNYVFENDEKTITYMSAPRLFRKGNIKFTGAIHNQWIFEGPLIDLETYVNHYGYIASDKNLMEKKYTRTSTILKNELEREPDNIYYRYQLSVTYKMHGDKKEAYEEAIKTYNTALEKGVDFRSYKYVIYQAAACSNDMKKWEEAEKYCSEGINIVDDYVDLYYHLAYARQNLEKWQESLETYKKYIMLAENYDNLAIKYDMSILMHSINCIDIAYYNMVILHQKLNNDDEAIECFLKITRQDEIKDALNVFILLCMKNRHYDKLRDYYYDRLSGNDYLQELFAHYVEENKHSAADISECDLEKFFSEGQDIYSLLNRCRISFGNNQDSELIKYYSKLHSTNRWQQMSVFYGEIIYFLLKLKRPVLDIFGKITELKATEFIKYCTDKYKDFSTQIYNNLNFNRTNEFKEIRTKKVLERCLLLMGGELSDDEYKNVFNDYIENGSIFMASVYNRVIIDCEMILDVKDNEEAFLIYMIKAIENKNKDSIKYLKYLKKALESYPEMKRGIELLTDEMNEENNRYSDNQEFDDYKAIVKDNIRTLIDTGNIAEANMLIKEYESIVPNDMEILILKSDVAVKLC